MGNGGKKIKTDAHKIIKTDTRYCVIFKCLHMPEQCEHVISFQKKGKNKLIQKTVMQKEGRLRSLQLGGSDSGFCQNYFFLNNLIIFNVKYNMFTSFNK